FASRLKARLKGDRSGDIYMFDEFPLLPALKGASVLPADKLKFFTWHEVLGDFYKKNGLLWKVAERWERKAAKVFTNNIAVSTTVASMIENRYQVPGVSVIENGVNVRELDNQKDKNWGKIIYIGRIEPHKRVDQLITKIGKMEKMELEVIGAGSQLNHIRH
ncbi:glycosyltransferase, partial [mine drainage metagenome]